MELQVGFYKNSEQLFGSFKHLAFNHLANNKIKIHIPENSTLTLQEGLRDLLGFKESTLNGGTHISDYQLELDGGITEIYVYSDIIESHFVGITMLPLLRIIPVMSKKEDQIVINYQRPLYFPLRKNYIDCIEIELRSRSGDVTLNDKQVSSQANYAYRCIFDALLSPRAVQESMLTSGLFYKDAASKHESVELANVGDNANSGYQTRYNICKDKPIKRYTTWNSQCASTDVAETMTSRTEIWLMYLKRNWIIFIWIHCFQRGFLYEKDILCQAANPYKWIQSFRLQIEDCLFQGSQQNEYVR
ncbi:hypothetical protein HNY73_013632 [Argiope bruennichi]|uniref:Uncharacterized protein n=1 Tax=Argiope bruennichi TaxID=94029 RepID=A0A8T0EYN4_ARGBR|nr:hypothetical protein HNY73_013632 [Argiope bruennichi]